MLGFFKTRDIIGALQWLQQADGALWYATTAGLFSTIGWRVWAAIRRHTDAKVAYKAAPNSKAIVKEKKS